MLATRVPLVDDDELVRPTLTGGLEQSGLWDNQCGQCSGGFKT